MKDNHKIRQAILHISYACTHHCPMCYANAKYDAEIPQLSQLCRVIDKMVEADIMDITLVGGDPAIYPEIIPLMDYIHKQGATLSVLSNTLGFNGCRDDALRSVDVVEGTIHHSCSSKHDAFCGCDGAYDTLVDNLRFFSIHGKSVGLAINIIPFNYNVIYQIIENVIKNGVNVDHIVVQRIIEFGRANGSLSYHITLDMANDALEQIVQAEKDFGIKIIFEDPLPMCAIDSKYRKYMHPCEWGYSKVSLDYNGNISRCGADTFNFIGSIFEDNINLLWDSAASIQEFREKKFLHEKCRCCEMVMECAGGCPISHEPKKGYSLDYLAK